MQKARGSGTFFPAVLDFPRSARQNRELIIEKEHAAEHPELVEGQAESLITRATA
jgi:hypothetical protein